MSRLAQPPSAASSSTVMVHAEGNAVMDVVTRAGDNGLTMGAIVETLERDGYAPQSVEMAIWNLLQSGKIVPCGFVCRTLRRRDGNGKLVEFRTYEFVLIRAPDQMELPMP